MTVRPAAQIALRLLRERVLARTRATLELDDATVVPAFAEVVDGEPIPAFLGRLLSAQNQLAAHRNPTWPSKRVRRALADGLEQGATETTELLENAGPEQVEGLAVVTEVLAEYARRLAALTEGIG